MEKVDVYNENGEKTGEVKPKDKAHRDGTWHSNHFDNCYLVQKEVNLSSLMPQEGEVSEMKFIHFTELENVIQQRNPKFIQHGEYANFWQAVSVTSLLCAGPESYFCIRCLSLLLLLPS